MGITDHAGCRQAEKTKNMLSTTRPAGVLASLCSSSPQISKFNLPLSGQFNLIQVRHRNVRIQKPDRANWDRQKLLAVSKPQWQKEEPIQDIWKNCEFAFKEAERKEYETGINKLEEFYVREMLENFERSKMIAFFHANPMTRRKFHVSWQNSRRMDMELKEYHHRIGLAGLTNTRWQNCLHFWFKFPGEMNLQPVLFSPDLDAAKLVKYEKKVAEFTLIGCVFGDRILSRSQIHQMVKLPDLSEGRAELVAVLGHHQQRTISLLQANQQQLCTNLSQLVKDAGEKQGSTQKDQNN